MKIHAARPDNDGRSWVRLLPPWPTNPPSRHVISLGDKAEASDLTAEQVAQLEKQLRTEVLGIVLTIE